MSAIEITGIFLGGLLSLVFVGYTFLTYSEKKRVVVNPPQRIAGIFTLVFGISMLGAWGYFLTFGNESAISNTSTNILHQFLELSSSLALIIAGVAMLRRWSRAPALLMTAMGIFIFSSVLALISYGPQGHPFLKNGMTFVVLIVFVYFIGLVYAWEHFVLGLDKDEIKSKKGKEVFQSRKKAA